MTPDSPTLIDRLRDAAQFHFEVGDDFNSKLFYEAADTLTQARAELARRAEPVADELCPNCLTPWKCNGPHEAAPPVSAGDMVLVPVEPTEAMLRAGREATHKGLAWGSVYSAMIAAAPAQEKSK